MAVCALRERERGYLPDSAFVCTVMSNLGLHSWAEENGLRAVCAQVGDRYVLEEMDKNGFLLGGEQSGHMIFLRHSAAGDGQLTALKLLSAMAETGKSLAELTDGIPHYPQVLINVSVSPDAKGLTAAAPAVAEAVAEARKALGEEGRVLVRPSGTEPLVRVMVEGKDEDEVARLAENIRAAVKKTQK
jgi:phosphoglucosamine mutase